MYLDTVDSKHCMFKESAFSPLQMGNELAMTSVRDKATGKLFDH